MKSDNNVILILTSILLLLLGVSGLLVVKQASGFSFKKQMNYTFSRTGVKPTPSVLGDSQALFSSPQLGIAFMYVALEGKVQIITKQIVNTIYIYPAGSVYTNESFITVFPKPATETFYHALEAYIGVNTNQIQSCIITVDPAQTFSEYQNAQFITATITSKVGSVVKCSVAVSNEFFLMDMIHPTRYVLIHKGFTTIFSTNQKKQSWEQSLRFL